MGRSKDSAPVALVLLAKEAAECLPHLQGVVANADVRVRLLLDSRSEDGTREGAGRLGWVVETVGGWFDHGGTRAQAVRKLREVLGREWQEAIAVFLTQDVTAGAGNGSTITRLVQVFEHGEIGAAYGRQLPRPGAKPIEAHARLFNYPDRSEIRSYEDRKRLGIKACFFSNSGLRGARLRFRATSSRFHTTASFGIRPRPRNHEARIHKAFLASVFPPGQEEIGLRGANSYAAGRACVASSPSARRFSLGITMAFRKRRAYDGDTLRFALQQQQLETNYRVGEFRADSPKVGEQ